MSKNSNSPNQALKNARTIGIVDLNCLRLAPIAQILLNRLAVESKNANVRSMKFFAAGTKLTASKVADSSKGFLQKQGYTTTDFMEPLRVNKDWLVGKDLIVCMDRFIRRDILHDYFPTSREQWASKIVVLSEIVGSTDNLRDPEEDPMIDTKQVYETLQKFCIALIKKLEIANP